MAASPSHEINRAFAPVVARAAVGTLSAPSTVTVGETFTVDIIIEQTSSTGATAGYWELRTADGTLIEQQSWGGTTTTTVDVEATSAGSAVFTLDVFNTFGQRQNSDDVTVSVEESDGGGNGGDDDGGTDDGNGNGSGLGDLWLLALAVAALGGGAIVLTR